MWYGPFAVFVTTISGLLVKIATFNIILHSVPFHRFYKDCTVLNMMNFLQGAYFGITTGLILTLWVCIGAQIYQPPVLGPVPPPMNVTHCPVKNASDNFASTTYLPELSSTARFGSNSSVLVM